jgi:hypothetical protein
MNVYSTGCKQSKDKPIPRSIISDIKWYEDDNKMVIEKSLQPDLVINFNEILTEASTTKDISIVDPDTGAMVLIPKGTNITDALQNVVFNLNNLIVHGISWSEWE